MPGRDRTGPSGTGPNGRGMGPCRSNTDTGAAGGFFGLGLGFRRGGGRGRGGRGRGFGAGYGLGWSAPYTQEDERQSLEAQKGWLQRQLEGISSRIDELGKSSDNQ